MDGREHVEPVKFWQGGTYSYDLSGFSGLSPGLGDVEFRLQSAADTKKLIESTRQSVTEAGTLLGELHIDNEHGLSRQEILKKQADPHTSAHDKKLLNLLLVNEKREYDYFNGADHMKLVKEDIEAEYHIGAAAEENDKFAAVPRIKRAEQALAADTEKQYDHYMHDKTVTPASLDKLKVILAQAETAEKILEGPEQFAVNLMRKLGLDPNEGGLKSGQVWSTLADPTKLSRLSKEEIDVFGQVQDKQRQMYKDLALSGRAEKPDGMPIFKQADITFDTRDLEVLAQQFAVRVAENSDMTEVVHALNVPAIQTATKEQFLQDFALFAYRRTDDFVSREQQDRKWMDEAWQPMRRPSAEKDSDASEATDPLDLPPRPPSAPHQ